MITTAGPGQDLIQDRMTHTPGYVCTDEACLCNLDTESEAKIRVVSYPTHNVVDLTWTEARTLVSLYVQFRTLRRGRYIPEAMKLMKDQVRPAAWAAGLQVTDLKGLHEQYVRLAYDPRNPSTWV